MTDQHTAYEIRAVTHSTLDEPLGGVPIARVPSHSLAVAHVDRAVTDLREQLARNGEEPGDAEVEFAIVTTDDNVVCSWHVYGGLSPIQCRSSQA
jgi:hypothetical protein